ncbi:hypothetical protein CBF45_07410 [Bordetella sp. J329]|nr:hypothetical protein CBF45_07410 [Bordetella sp. J329]
MTDMSKAAFHILYDGPALVNHEMNVNDLAPALLALGDVIEAANDALNGTKRARVSLNVKASFKTGCFGIELDVAQTLMQQVGALFSAAQAVTAKDLLRWLGFAWENGDKAMVYGGGLLWLLKKMRGRPIEHATRLESGKVRIMIDGEPHDIEGEVIDLYRNAKLRKALSEVLKPLENEGINEFAVTDKPQSARFFSITESERAYFAPPGSVVEELKPTEVETNLQLVSISFRQDNKWRFSEGDQPFYANIVDQTFLDRVQGNESFSAGDRLRVRLRRNQRMVDGSLKVDFEIIEVLDHQKGSSQIPIQFDDEQPSARKPNKP